MSPDRGRTPALGALLLLGQLAAADGPDAAAGASVQGCLPDQSGNLSMRLRGSIERTVEAREPALACSGMSRPDGQGLRLHFVATLPDIGEFAVVFAAPQLGRGVSARGVPVNVTLLDRTGGAIYGTRGDHACQLDEIEQQPLEGPGLPPASYRVSGRGFCTVPAPAVDGDGAVLLTRFDFAGMVSYGDDQDAAPDIEDAALPPWLAELDQGDVEVATITGRHRFRVWIADDEAAHARGLMYVEKLPADRGMLFLFDPPRFASFWMKNTYLPLDIVFIGPDGRVVNIARDAEPFSLGPIESVGPVTAVLEFVAGTAARIALAAGDRVVHAALAAPVAEG